MIRIPTRHMRPDIPMRPTIPTCHVRPIRPIRPMRTTRPTCPICHICPMRPKWPFPNFQIVKLTTPYGRTFICIFAVFFFFRSVFHPCVSDVPLFAKLRPASFRSNVPRFPPMPPMPRTTPLELHGCFVGNENPHVECGNRCSGYRAIESRKLRSM